MDLVVGEIKNTYIHTGQCFLVRRHFEVGESKVQFYSSAVLVCNVYELKWWQESQNSSGFHRDLEN